MTKECNLFKGNISTGQVVYNPLVYLCDLLYFYSFVLSLYMIVISFCMRAYVCVCFHIDTNFYSFSLFYPSFISILWIIKTIFLAKWHNNHHHHSYHLHSLSISWSCTSNSNASSWNLSSRDLRTHCDRINLFSSPHRSSNVLSRLANPWLSGFGRSGFGIWDLL